MMALEAQPVRRDDAVELVQRREADRDSRRRGEPRDVAADDMRLVFRRLAVGPHGDAVAEQRASSPARWAAGLPDCRAPRPRRSAPWRHRGRRRCAESRGAEADLASRSFMPPPSTGARDPSTNRHMRETMFLRYCRNAEQQPLGSHDAHALGFLGRDHALVLRRDFSTTSQIGGPFGALVHARPAGDDVFRCRLERLAGLAACVRSEMRLPDRLGRRRSCSRARRSAPCRRPAGSRDRD